MDSSDCNRVLRHLCESAKIGKVLRLDDFSGLGLSNNHLGECIRCLKAQGWCDGHVHETSRDDSGVDALAAWITPAGCQELGYQAKVYVHGGSVLRNGLPVRLAKGVYDVRVVGFEERRTVGVEDYEFSQDGEPKFTLSASELGTCLQRRDIVVQAGSLP